MQLLDRILKIDLPPRQSAFLWGARKTGKSTYLKTRFPDAVYYDLLKSDIFLRLAARPNLFREELLAISGDRPQVVILDEVQKAPALLDEVHWLIENTSFSFILCGSSARKLKRHGVNLLGGRAWKYHFFPLVYPELPDFDLLRIFNRGAIPAHFLQSAPGRSLRAYLEDYMTQEVQAEGLVRNLPAFSRFMEALRFSHGEMINYANIARQAGVDGKTVREHFSILVDTLMGYFVLPYRKRVGREIISETPRFFLFDVGVANMLMRRRIDEMRGSEAGRSLEHYLLTELMAYKHLKELDFDISYWRTKTGLEVDLVLGAGEVAVEVTVTDPVDKTDIKGLLAFVEEHRPKRAYVVATEPRPRRISVGGFSIDVLPVQTFLELLWNGSILS